MKGREGSGNQLWSTPAFIVQVENDPTRETGVAAIKQETKSGIFVSQNPRKENATRRIERSVVLAATENSNKKAEKLPLDFATLTLEVVGNIAKRSFSQLE